MRWISLVLFIIVIIVVAAVWLVFNLQFDP